MKVTKEIEKLENSAVKLTITIDKDDVAVGYDETLKKYSKNLQLPGFRKGKVPVSVLERKYGDALKNDVAGELIEKALEEVFGEFDNEKSENRPLAYSQPQLDSLPQLDVTKDLVFSVIYDIMPTVKIDNFAGIKIEEPQVEITDDDMNEELKAIQERNAMVLDKKDSESAANGDIATINYSELDESGAEIAGTKREGFVFTIGSGENIFKIDDEIIGMKKDETKEISKTYSEDFADKDLAGTSKKIKVTLTALKIRDLPALDDELAQDVNEKYKTLDDLKADIKKNLNVAKDNRIKEIKSNSLIEQLVEKNPVELPQSMLNAELESRWRMMAQRFQCSVEQLDKLMTSSGQKKEDLLNEWSDDAAKMLKGRIIVESLLKESKIEVTPEEVEDEYNKIAEGAGISVEEVKKHYADAVKKEYLIDDIKEQKLYTELFTKVKITKGEKKKFADLFKNA